ncbi:SAM-dependent methyltransferase [Allohahella sp. A8]|uniref:SAM-dependent methyltransferase n=1 Tax=Allohahella sp. A8 TaxID=3141461 RepID=UPI003A810246
MNVIKLAEDGWLPDSMIRFGIRRLCVDRLKTERRLLENSQNHFQQRLQSLRESPIAIETEAANTQHYEVPASFYEHVLGRHLKYSACLFNTPDDSLDEAEQAMLALYCDRAGLENGHRILDLGCGWGSLSLFMAARYPESRVTGVSNSSSQRNHIMAQARLRGLRNIEIITCDVNELDLEKGLFDRVVSVEMLEHVRNYQNLFERISEWLSDDGLFFAHIFCHQELMYPFEAEGSSNWMGRHFFTGGLMPALDTFSHFNDHLVLEEQWQVNGMNYAYTAERWLQNLDRNRVDIERAFLDTLGPKEATVWIQRWRMFFMACAELFGYNDGNEWLVGHYLFCKRS